VGPGPDPAPAGPGVLLQGRLADIAGHDHEQPVQHSDPLKLNESNLSPNSPMIEVIHDHNYAQEMCSDPVIKEEPENSDESIFTVDGIKQEEEEMDIQSSIKRHSSEDSSVIKYEHLHQML